MRFRYSPNRAFDVAAPVEIYRVVGRRPSALWVDDAFASVASATGKHQLNELVYWRTRAEPGEQIHEHDRGLFLMTADDDCHPITLTPPVPLEAATAFTHAQAVLSQDVAAIDRLSASGQLVAGKARQPPRPPTRPVDRVLEPSHPLVTDEQPAEADRPLRQAPQAFMR